MEVKLSKSVEKNFARIAEAQGMTPDALLRKIIGDEVNHFRDPSNWNRFDLRKCVISAEGSTPEDANYIGSCVLFGREYARIYCRGKFMTVPMENVTLPKQM